MTEFEIWFIYLLVVGFCAVPAFLIKEKTKNIFLKIIKNVAGFLFVLIGITFLVWTFFSILFYVFPSLNNSSGGNGVEECERDPLFGGCN